MRTDILETVLSTAGVGVSGSTLFVHQMPATCVKGVVIKMPLQGIPVDNELPGFFKCKFQVIVRAPTQAEGEVLCNQVTNALVSHANREYFDPPGNVFAMRINYLLASELPIRYPRLDGNGIEWSLNFDCSFVLPA